MGYVAPIVMALGALVKGGADSQAAKAEAALYGQNANLASFNASVALQQGEIAAEQIGVAGNQMEGTIRAGAAAHGLSANEGSAVDLQESNAYQTSMDIYRARYSARAKAYGYQVESQNLKYMSKLKKKESSGALFGGLLNAVGSLYGGAA